MGENGLMSSLPERRQKTPPGLLFFLVTIVVSENVSTHVDRQIGPKFRGSNKEAVMAIEKPEGHHCKVTFHEDGRVWSRRIHELAVQAVDGGTYRVSGKGLPTSIDLYTGK